MTVYMILAENPDWNDNARIGDTDDFICEEYGYFTDKDKAEAFADQLNAEVENIYRESHGRKEEACKKQIELDNKEAQILIDHGLDRKLRTYTATPFELPWQATLYEVVGIEPA